jgi:hypothetical protein
MAKKAFEFVDTTAVPVTYHIQVRVDENGPVKRDGRRGRIILEDPNAPVEVLRWLKSPDCRRADRGTGKAVHVWCNEAMVPAASAEVPDADGETEETLPVPTAPQLPPQLEMAMKIGGAYQIRLEKLTELLEDQLSAARDQHKKEIAMLRAAAAAEVESCDKQIAAARERLAKEREREDTELEAMAARRRAMVEERSLMSKDLRTEIDTNREYRQMLAASMKKSDMVETIVNAGVKLKEHGIPVDDIAGAAATWIMSKAGVKVSE